MVVTLPGRLRRSSGPGKHHARLQPANVLKREAEPNKIGVGEEKVKIAAKGPSFCRNTVSRKGPPKSRSRGHPSAETPSRGRAPPKIWPRVCFSAKTPHEEVTHPRSWSASSRGLTTATERRCTKQRTIAQNIRRQVTCLKPSGSTQSHASSPRSRHDGVLEAGTRKGRRRRTGCGGWTRTGR